MRWKPALFYAFCVLIFVAVFVVFTRPEKPAVAKPAAAPSAAEINVPVSDGRWEQLKASLPQWLREKAQQDNRPATDLLNDPYGPVLTGPEAEAWIKDFEAVEIAFRNGRVHIGEWIYDPESEQLGNRTASRFGFVFLGVHYAENKWSYRDGRFANISIGRPSRSTPNSPVSR